VLVEHLLEALVEVCGRDDIAACSLDGLDVEGREFALARLRIPHGVVLVLELARELPDDMFRIFLGGHSLGATERIRERDELSPLAEVTEPAPVAIAGGDARCAQRAAVIPALEGEHQALAVTCVAHHFQRILDRLRTAHVEVNAARKSELPFGILSDPFGQLDLRRMKVLARDLRQGLHLAQHHRFEALVLVAEVDRGIPHLQVEVGHPFGVVHVASIASCKYLWRIDVVHGVAEGAVACLIDQ